MDDSLAPAATVSQVPTRVLIAWRPDSPGNEALELAAWLARTTDIHLRVVNTFVRPWPSTSLSKLGGKYRKWFKKEAEATEAATKQALLEAGVDKRCWDEEVSVFADGPSESVLLTAAAVDFDAELIILGSEAAAPKGKFLAGSTADAMLHSSPKPLALAPRAPKLAKRGINRINFAFLDNNSEDFHGSLSYAARQAIDMDASLRLLAFSPSGIADVPTAGAFDFSGELIDEWREHSLSLLDRAHDFVHTQFPEIAVESEVGSGAGWSGAIDALKWKKGDLLIFGSPSPGSITRVFLGSTATEFLRHLHVPVIVHPGDYGGTHE